MGSHCEDRRRHADASRWLAACLLLAGAFGLSLAASAEEPKAPAADADAKRPELTDLVVAQESVFHLDRFEQCRVEGQAEPIQILIHSEARQSEISRDRFVARTATATVRRLDQVLAEREAAAAKGSPDCREVAAPNGDVDYELHIRPAADPIEVRVVDIAKRKLTQPTAVRYSETQCGQDVQGNTFCAASAYGSAVRSSMGEIMCARGQCVRGSGISEWHCSRASGGWAEMSAGGRAVCQQGCYRPTPGQCRRMR